MFFELLQVALGNRERLSRVPSAKEWEEIYDESGRQAVTGILLHGIDRLPAEQRPSQAVLFQWIGEGQIVEQRNRVLDERCCKLLKMLEEQGQKGTILKGQGIARLYDVRVVREGRPSSSKSEDNLKENHSGSYTNLSALRQPGDIDVFVDCGLKKTIAFAKATGQKNVEWDYKHLHLNIWDDTEVEMHYRVEVLLNLWKNRKLQKWFKEHENEIFDLNNNHNLNSNTNRTNDTNNKENSHKTDWTDRMITPTVEFNVFYILLHIYRHFLYEGVGMRQIVDYYMVLRTVNLEKQSVGYAIDAVSDFGIDKFAKGLMWVMKEALGMSEEWMLWEPNQKEGDYILKQVMKGGNFGHYDDRLKHGGGKLGAVKAILAHNLHLLTHYPSDVIWAPVWIVWHKLWKMTRRLD